MTEGEIITKAWKDWLNTEHGKKCMTEPVSQPYLKNRLESAFLEGFERAKKLYAAADEGRK